MAKETMKKNETPTESEDSKIVRNEGVASTDLFSADAHAVRWALYMIMCGHEIYYSHWHWTTDADRTICNRPIRLVNDKCNTILPEHDENVETVTCKHCRRKLGR